MDPTGPSQPSLNTVYDQPANPAQSSNEHESSTSTAASQQRSAPVAERRSGTDRTRTDATPTSLAMGEVDGRNDLGEKYGPAASNTEGEQMRAAGEGDIARAQDEKEGFGEQPDMLSGLDRKKAEQAEIKNARSDDAAGGSGKVDVGAAIGGGAGFVGASGNQSAGQSAGGTGSMQGDHSHV